MSAKDFGAAILAVGDELLDGELADRNGPWLAERLATLGWRVREVRLVGDDELRLARAMAELSDECSLVITTGGLGPTMDDVTRHAAARASGCELVIDPGVLEELETDHGRRGRAMPASNERQALFPRGAAVLANPAGTAPGFRVPVGDAWLIALPGPPFEMRAVFETSLAPWLAERAGGAARRHLRRLHLFGLSESEFADRAGDWMRRDARPRLGVLAHSGVLTVKVEAEESDGDDAGALVEARLDDLRRCFGARVFGADGADLATVVGEALIETGTPVAVAESCTGGLVARKLVAVPGISAVFREGFVPYADEAKIERLGVAADLLREHGAVSAPVAEAMARGAAERARARLAVATTGIAGPGGGSPGKPVGLVWFAVAHDGQVRSERRLFPPRGRRVVQEWAALTALDLLRGALESRAGA